MTCTRWRKMKSWPTESNRISRRCSNIMHKTLHVATSLLFFIQALKGIIKSSIHCSFGNILGPSIVMSRIVYRCGMEDDLPHVYRRLFLELIEWSIVQQMWSGRRGTRTVFFFSGKLKSVIFGKTWNN